MFHALLNKNEQLKKRRYQSYCSRRISGKTLIRYAKNRNIGKPKILSFRSNKTKGPKQDSQNRLMSPMPEGGEP